MPERGGKGQGGHCPPPHFGRSVNAVPTRSGGQILPTLYYWHSQFFSSSGITEPHKHSNAYWYFQNLVSGISQSKYNFFHWKYKVGVKIWKTCYVLERASRKNLLHTTKLHRCSKHNDDRIHEWHGQKSTKSFTLYKVYQKCLSRKFRESLNQF